MHHQIPSAIIKLMDLTQKSKATLSPLIITAIIIVIDQLSKYFITIFIPQKSYIKVWGEFLWICHVRNTGAAFGLGAQLEDFARIVVLFIIPTAVIIYLLYASTYMKWQTRYKILTSVIAGGGIGNMIDRFTRSEGVVDFISVKMFGIFGIERWPTFNIADTSIVISMIVWIVFAFFTKEKKPTNTPSINKEDEKKNKKEPMIPQNT